MSPAWLSVEDADRALTEYARRHGHPDLSGRQLKRWRSAGLLPHREVRGRGRAAGVCVRDPASAGPQLVALCHYRERFARSTTKLAVSLWYDWWEVSPSRVREAVAEYCRAMGRRAEARAGDVSGQAQSEAAPRTRSLNGVERMLIADLPGRFDDPSGRRRSGRELVVDARTDVIGAMLVGPAYAADEELVTAYFQLDRLDEVEGRPAGHSLRSVTPDVLDRASLDYLIPTIEQCSDEDLERVRIELRWRFEALAAIREGPLEVGIPLIEKWLPTISTYWDTRDPNFDPRQLLVAIGGTLVVAPLFPAPTALDSEV